MRLALFGGTFDPIHTGHIQAALASADACKLDRVLVVPSGTPPHKPDACRASYEHRLRMVELACAADPRLEASRLEEPGREDGPHFTVNTVERVRSTIEFEGALRFIIGADAFAEIGIWRESERVIEAVEFLVVGRPGSEPVASGLSPAPATRDIECSHPASSSLVRHRVKMGGTLTDLVPSRVAAYIWENGLYHI